MKHILIITLGFPPANSMSSHRNFIRAKGFDEQGYRVSVVTRFWKKGQGGVKLGEPSPREITSEKLFTNTTVYRVPFGPDQLRDLNLAQRAALQCLRADLPAPLRKAAENICFFVCPVEYGFRLTFSVEELARMLVSPPDFVLASGDPWSNFEIGQKTAKFFKAKYIAEYRDPWNYIDEKFRIEGFNTYNSNVISQFKRRYSAVREKRFNSGADLIIAASKPFLENALAVTGVKKGMVVTNGFDRAEIEPIQPETYRRFTLCYIGTIYSQQKSEIFFKALQTFIDTHKIDPKEICVKMVGSKVSHGFEATLKQIKHCAYHEQIVEYLDRLDKLESLKIQKSSGVLLFFAHEKSVGIYPGKIFEYIATGTPILLVPSDHGVLEALINETRTGAVCNNEAEVVKFLEKQYFSWKKNGQKVYHPDRNAVEEYSYKKITGQLISMLENL